MNHLLNHISWNTYLATAALIAIAYYAYVARAYYRADIAKLIHKLTSKPGDSHDLPSVLQYNEGPQQAAPSEIHRHHPKEDYEQEPAKSEGIAYELEQELMACIEAHAGKTFSPAHLIPQLKKILNDYPDLAATPIRRQINLVIVRECERNGTALLTESEVDMWWSA